MDHKKRMAQVVQQGRATAHLGEFEKGSFCHDNLGELHRSVFQQSAPWGVPPNIRERAESVVIPIVP